MGRNSGTFMSDTRHFLLGETYPDDLPVIDPADPGEAKRNLQ